MLSILHKKWKWSPRENNLSSFCCFSPQKKQESAIFNLQIHGKGVSVLSIFCEKQKCFQRENNFSSFCCLTFLQFSFSEESTFYNFLWKLIQAQEIEKHSLQTYTRGRNTFHCRKCFATPIKRNWKNCRHKVLFLPHQSRETEKSVDTYSFHLP